MRPAPWSQGLKYKASVGLDVDKQQMTIAARPTDLINGAPFLTALRDGAFDGASVQRDRVFLSGPSWLGSDAIGGFAVGASAIDAVGVVGVIGGVTMFKGRISTVDSVGRTSATITVASDLVILDYDMPRNLFSPTCVHTLYDSGCGVIRGTFAVSGIGRRRVDAKHDLSAVAAAQHAQGSLVFSSGANANVRATVKSVGVGVGFNLMYPLPFAPSAGRRLHRLCRLRPHARDLSGAVRQQGKLSRLPVRPAGRDGLLTMARLPCELSFGLAWSLRQRASPSSARRARPLDA